MNLEDFDISAITTGLATVAIVVGVIVLAVLGRPIPEILIISMSTVLGYIYGRASGTPGTKEHVRALRANTEATQAVATTLEQATPLVGLAATAALTEATDRNTATQVATAVRNIAALEKNTESNVATNVAAELRETQGGLQENTQAQIDNTRATDANTEGRLTALEQAVVPPKSGG